MDHWAGLLVYFVGPWGLDPTGGVHVVVLGPKGFIRMGLAEVWVRRTFAGLARPGSGRHPGPS